MKLLVQFKDSSEQEQQTQRQNIVNIINGNAQLRSKRELIERFIDGHLMSIADVDSVDEAFETFWEKERTKAFDALCEEENLNKEEVKKVVDTYLYDSRPPLGDDIANTLNVKPKLLERRKVVPRVLEKIMTFVERFYG